MPTTELKRRELNLETLILGHGSHNTPKQGLCIMEAVAFAAGEPHSDHPECACPVIGAFARRLNDALPQEERQCLKTYIFPLIGSKRTPEVENKRRWMAVDWAVRVATPFCLREAKLEDHAKALEALPEITNYVTRDQAWPVIAAARDAACEARRKNWEKLSVAQRRAAAAEAAAAAAAAEAEAVAAAAAAEAAEAVAAAAAAAAAEAVAVAVAVAAEAVAVAAVAVAVARKIRAGLTASAEDLVTRMLAVKE